MRSRHCAAECRLDRWSSCIHSMSDLGQSAVLTVRPWADRVYGVPPEQVVGSSIRTRFQDRLIHINSGDLFVRYGVFDVVSSSAGRGTSG